MPFNLDVSGPRALLWLLFTAFWIWMLIDAIRREEWLWAVFIFIFPFLNAPLYYFLVYRNAARPGRLQAFQFPGAVERHRIKELEAQIHHLDKAHHHLQLGDIYYQQGKFTRALECYQSAHERDGADPDIRAHLGQCLLRLNRPEEARPLLEAVCAENPRHDYGHTLMGLAETHAALGDTDQAIQTWRRVLQENGYARARVQLAELLIARGDRSAAREELREVAADDAHAPAFQRKRDAAWTRRAAKLIRTLEKETAS